ncbi:hypothetical protein Tco_0956098 [Tanacetum coccineum]|uniref:Uncharacterized protein n=1 Tax=Tanacetum coccineum TaxID=301880 RepID=A0ABQ5E923_9ASTR
MGDANPIRTLGDYSKPSHEGYGNTIELPKGNNVVPLQSDTIREGSYYSFPYSILSTGKDCKTPQRYSDVPTTSRRISLRSMDSSNTKMPVKKVEKENEAENGTKNKPIKRAEREEALEAPSSQPIGYYLKHRINEKLIKGLVDNHRIPESISKVDKGIKNDIEPIATTMTVNRLVLEWEERIKLHQEKEMDFDQLRNKNFKNKHPALVEVKGEKNEGEVT